MLNVIFTLDYEIHGNGEGCPSELMVEPTRRMMDLFDRYGAKLTIMADVAEILKFKEYQGAKPGATITTTKRSPNNCARPSGAATTSNFTCTRPISTRGMRTVVGNRTGRNTILRACPWIV